MGVGVGVGVAVAVGVGVGVLVGVEVGVNRIVAKGSGRGRIAKDRANPTAANTDRNTMMANRNLRLIGDAVLLQRRKLC